MNYPYTFKINGVDFSSKVKIYTYNTTYTPVYSEVITTMDKRDHAVIVRWRHGLELEMMPLTEAELAALQAALGGRNIATVEFGSLQLGYDVTAQMMLSTSTATLVLKNASRRVLGDIPMSFTEM